ncbi:transposable element Tcb2 transposase [Trichonephila clavipes]|nr:transposable element Tcb2 transposase [Trichonephila clavipes]
MVNAVIDTGAQMPVVRPDVVEGQSIDNRGSIHITSAFGKHEMGEVKDSNMELNDLRDGVVPASKNLVNDMLICSSDYEGLIENSQLIRNPTKLREHSKEEGTTDSKSVCRQEVITDLRPETYTQSLLNVRNGDLVAVKINALNVQTNGQDIKESKREVAFICVFKNRILYSNRRAQPRKECIFKFIDSTLVQCCRDRITGVVNLELKTGLAVFKKLLGTVDTRRYPRAENRRPRGERIVRQALVDHTVTRSTIRADVGVAIVPQTISRHLAETNLKSKRPFRALPLTPEHRQLRLQWCQEARSMWNVTDWQNVVFSDE